MPAGENADKRTRPCGIRAQTLKNERRKMQIVLDQVVGVCRSHHTTRSIAYV